MRALLVFQADETGERRLGSGLVWEAELVRGVTLRGERPRPSMSSMSSGSVDKNLLIEPTEVPFLGRDLPDRFLIFRCTNEMLFV